MYHLFKVCLASFGLLILLALLLPSPEPNEARETRSETPVAQAPAQGNSAIALVAPEMTGVNPWGVSADDLTVMENPEGEGQIVYIPQVQERLGQPINLLWVVVARQAYAVNGPSKELAPGLPWPREAPGGVWNTTGLDPFQATATIRMVFGGS